MTKYRFNAIILCAVLLAVSCQLQEPMRTTSGYSMFYAETEQPAPDTKTFADEQGMVLWVNGDLVSVFNKKSYATKYRYDGGTGTTGGVLTEVPESGAVTGTDVSHYYAIYPYESYNGLDNSENLITKIRNGQTWDYCSFGPGDNLMVAVSDDDRFQFKNVGGYLVLRLYGEGSVSSITLQGNNNEVLAGDVKVTATIGGDPVAMMQKGSRYTTYKSVTLECDEPVDLTGTTKDSPEEFWFVIPATTFTQGLTFVVTDPEGKTFEKSTSNEIVVQRSHAKPLKTQVDFMQSPIQFEDANFKAYCVESFDDNGDQEISLTEALTIESIDVYTDDIASLGGIEHMSNLRSLIARALDEYHSPDEPGGLLTDIDLSGNLLLEECDLGGNQISYIDISMLPNLRRFNANNNPLVSIDFQNNPLLYNISLNGAYQLESIPEMRHLNLEHLHLSGCAQKITDPTYLGSFPNLRSVNISEYEGTDIDLSDNNNIEGFWAYNCPNLEVLDLTSTEVKNLYITGCPNLTEVIVPAGTVFENLEKDDHTVIIYDGLVVNKYLTFTSEGTTSLSLRNDNRNAPKLYYSYDATNWALWNYSGLTFTNESPLYICGDNPEGITNDVNYQNSRFVSSGDTFAISGDIMSLINKDIDVRVIPSDDCFSGLFRDCTNLTKAPELPATVLADWCYENMFYGCTCLVEAPALPATELEIGCYWGMFLGCKSLRTAPELPAIELADVCYDRMFFECISLVEAPALPATELMYGCYWGMFQGCKSLRTAPELPAISLTGECYGSMFYGCTSLSKAPELPATTLADYCYKLMFSGCTNLVDVYDLPADNLTHDAYANMFSYCTSLRAAPKIVATTFAHGCCYEMFKGCTNLLEVPDLMANTMADVCCMNMFEGCTSLESAPFLPATILAKQSYQGMFAGCTSLSHVECMAADISAEGCVSGWLNGVSSTGTFVKAASMNDWPVGASGIPEGWSVQDVN